MKEKQQEKSPIKQNILRYLEKKGVTSYEFYKDSGVTRGILQQNNGISEENIARFLAYAQDVNIEWLVTGKGCMLKNNSNNIQTQLEHANYTPLYDRLSILIGIVGDVDLLADYLGIEGVSLMNCSNNGVEPKEKINFDRFLSDFPEFNKEWIINGVGLPFGEENGEKDNLIKQIKQRIHNKVLQENCKIIEEWLSAKKASNQKIGIPLIPLSAMAGAFTDETTVMEYECERYVIPAFKQAEYLIQVKGDSMQPTYYPGDLVACQRVPMGDVFFQWNKTYVLDTNQGPLIKRILPGSDADHISIVSDNTKYLPFELSKDQINGIALVCGIVRLE